MDLIGAYQSCFRQYAGFSGRARRREYWLFYLANLLISTVFSLAGYVLMAQYPTASSIVFGLLGLYSLVVFLPGLAVTVRRLHDTDRSGWSILLSLIPLAGPIILLVFICTNGTAGENRFGSDPKGSAASSFVASESSSVDAAGSDSTFPIKGSDDLGRTVSVQDSLKLRVDCIQGLDKGAHAEGDLVYVGREPQLCQLVMRYSETVSRTHCMIHLNNGKIEVMDLNSTNGTFLANGTRLKPNKKIILENGSKLYLGSRETVIFVGVA